MQYFKDENYLNNDIIKLIITYIQKGISKLTEEEKTVQINLKKLCIFYFSLEYI